MKYFFIVFYIILIMSHSSCKNEIHEIDQNVFLFKEANFPFPQHVTYQQGVILPEIDQNLMDQKTVEFYETWKNTYVKSFSPDKKYIHYTLEYPVENAISCSEGHGFGMLISVLMAGSDTLAYDTYVKLYNFYKEHPSEIDPALMAWQQDNAGNDINGANSATDGDLDIAYSLLLAHYQWGSDGNVNFLADAKKMFKAIMQHDINTDYKTIKLGDWVSAGNKYYEGTRCCDFMLDHLRAFSLESNETDFSEIIDTVYNVINMVSHETTGLFPDFVKVEEGQYIPCPPNYLEGPDDGNYYYNSCRAPWRIATDYIVYGDDRAIESLNRLNNWIKTIASGSPDLITAGYQLDGTALNDWNDMAFTAPFGVSAMIDVEHQLWLNNLWNEITQTSIYSDSYFGNSIKMICLIVMSGNWWVPEYN